MGGDGRRHGINFLYYLTQGKQSTRKSLPTALVGKVGGFHKITRDIRDLGHTVMKSAEDQRFLCSCSHTAVKGR